MIAKSTATESLIEVPTIDSIEQNEKNGGFTGDQKEVKFFYQDNGLIDNYYLEEYNSSFTILPEYDVIDDSFSKEIKCLELYKMKNENR